MKSKRSGRPARSSTSRIKKLPKAGSRKPSGPKHAARTAPPLTSPTRRFIVRGRISEANRSAAADGKPVAGVLVRAFGKDMRSEEVLGTAVTDAGGRFEIAYAADRFKRAEKKTADLIVRLD